MMRSDDLLPRTACPVVRRHARHWLCLLWLALCTTPVAAALDESARLEIEQLLTRLETSGCEFFRNGKWYDAARARRHLERKYDWLLRRDLIASAEQFIERAATGSSRSGEPYRVRCPDAASLPSANWLRQELGRLRAPAEE